MDSKELIRRLKDTGFTLLRVNGSHHVFGHADGRRVVVKDPCKDIPTGTLRNIFRQAAWPWPPREGGKP